MGISVFRVPWEVRKDSFEFLNHRLDLFFATPPARGDTKKKITAQVLLQHCTRGRGGYRCVASRETGAVACSRVLPMSPRLPLALRSAGSEHECHERRRRRLVRRLVRPGAGRAGAHRDDDHDEEEPGGREQAQPTRDEEGARFPGGAVPPSFCTPPCDTARKNHRSSRQIRPKPPQHSTTQHNNNNNTHKQTNVQTSK